MKGSIGVFAVILAAVVLLVGSQAFFIVDETEYAIVQQFQEIKSVSTSPGIFFRIPFIQKVTKLDKRVLTSDTLPQEYLTSDEKRIMVDQVTRWRIKDPRLFFLKAQTELGGQARLEPLVLAELRAQVAKRLYDTMISSERDQIMDDALAAVQLRVDDSQLGIHVIDVRTKRADLPPDVEANVFARMQSARQVEADRHRAKGKQKSNEITSETDRLVTVMGACANRVAEETKGDGDAAAVAIFGQALSQDPEFFTFMRRLEAYSETFLDSDRLVLSTDSDFFKLLTGEGVVLREHAAPVSIGEPEPVVPLTEDITPRLTQTEVDELIQVCIPDEATE